MREVILTEREIEVLKSCIFMALCEGLYNLAHIPIKDAGEKDIEQILEKIGMSKAEAEEFIKDGY